jgi:hypothetical protein
MGLLRDVVADHYRAVTRDPWYTEGGDAMSFRLYLGATPIDPVEGMFSFVRAFLRKAQGILGSRGRSSGCPAASART